MGNMNNHKKEPIKNLIKDCLVEALYELVEEIEEGELDSELFGSNGNGRRF